MCKISFNTTNPWESLFHSALSWVASVSEVTLSLFAFLINIHFSLATATRHSHHVTDVHKTTSGLRSSFHGHPVRMSKTMKRRWVGDEREECADRDESCFRVVWHQVVALLTARTPYRSTSTFVYNTGVRIIRYFTDIIHSAIQTLEHALIWKQQIQTTDLERVLISTRVDEIQAKVHDRTVKLRALRCFEPRISRENAILSMFLTEKKISDVARRDWLAAQPKHFRIFVARFSWFAGVYFCDIIRLVMVTLSVAALLAEHWADQLNAFPRPWFISSNKHRITTQIQG